jgi:hypothetical protein
VTVLLTTTACASVTQKSLEAQGLKPMTEQQLRERYARPVRQRFVTAQNQGGTGEYLPDGTARVSFLSGAAGTGKWTIKNGTFCTQYPQLRQGEEACFVLYQTGPKETMSFHVVDGTHNSTNTAIE